VADGLAQSQVLCMLEDQRGYLWLGTQGGGLNRFDGLDFEVFTVRDGLINNNIDALFEDEQRLYIGAKNGFSVYDGRNFQNYFIDKERNIAVTTFIKYRDKVLIGTSEGVYEFQNGAPVLSKKINSKSTAGVTHFLNDSQGNLWIGTTRGLLKFEGDRLLTLRASDGFTNTVVSEVLEAADSSIWLATYDGAFVYQNNRFTKVSEDGQGSASKYINTILADKSGQIWLGTQDQGISILNPRDTSWLYLNDELGLCNNNVKVLLQDSWGSIWIGTSGGGICKYVGQQFNHINLSNRPGDNLVYALAQDTSGAMWLAAADDGVVRLDSSGITRFNRSNGFVDSKTKALLTDSKGRMWLGTNDYGVAYFNGNNFEFLRKNGRPVGRVCKDLIEDRSGNIWLASSSEGVLKVNPRDTVLQFTEIIIDSIFLNDSLVLRADTIRRDSVALRYTVQSIPELATNINDLLFDQMGRLWFASRLYGVGYWTEKGVVRYGIDAGLPSNDIRSIVEDDYGHLWIGTAGYGIVRINLYTDSLNLITYNETNGLSSGNVYLLAFDPMGDLWVGCGRGVDRIELDEEQQVKAIRAYRKADGFLGAETCQNASYLDRDGNLWFGTIDGATKYIPGEVQRNLIPPKLHFQQIELFNQPFEQSDFAKWIDFDNRFKKGLALPYRQNDLSFEFKGINLANPRQVVYQWMLEGRDSEWSRRSTKTSVNYSNLPPGNYTFRVRAFNEDLVFNTEPLTTSFSIQTPIWQRPWFILTSIILLASFIALIFRYRVRQVKRKAKVEQDRLEMENQVLQLEQKALQLQMNPHFIFNALNTVQSLFMSKDQDTARKLLSQFAKLMRSILEHSRTNTISLRQEVELLNNYLSIEQFSRPNSFEFTVNVDSSIDPEEVNIPPMMIQPFVENAIIHGVSHLKTAGRIDLKFERSNDQLLCIIRDNGIGRKAANKIQAQNTRSHQSLAMQVTKDRLSLLDTESRKKPQFEIIDLVESDGTPSGTEVRLLLPLEEW
jgi:ligand-binding sensor domain-containing protein/two-component sensor histidine kinase